MARIIQIGTVSSRGQIAIPVSVRKELELEVGEKMLFILEGDTLIIKRVAGEETFAHLTEPFRKAEKKINEKEVVELIHKARKRK